jgi:hypothetical protein
MLLNDIYKYVECYKGNLMLGFNEIINIPRPYPNVSLSLFRDHIITTAIAVVHNKTRYLEYGVYLGGTFLQVNYIARCLGQTMKFDGIENFKFLNWDSIKRATNAETSMPQNPAELELFIHSIMQQEKLLNETIRDKILNPGQIDCKIYTTAAELTIADPGVTYDIIHLDGDHNYDGVVQSFNDTLQFSHDETMWVFDDYSSLYIDVVCAADDIKSKYGLSVVVGTQNKLVVCKESFKRKIIQNINAVKELFKDSDYDVDINSTKQLGTVLTLNTNRSIRKTQFQQISVFQQTPESTFFQK